MFQAFDAIFGEGRYAIRTHALYVQAAVFREHVDREFVQPVLIFAEHFGDVVDGEDSCDGAQGQAADRQTLSKRSPIPRQEFVELADRLVVDAAEHVGEPAPDPRRSAWPSKSSCTWRRRSFRPAFGAGEEPRLSSKRNHPFILPMSGKKSRSITVGIPSTVAVFGSNTASSAPAAGLSTSRRRPA